MCLVLLWDKILFSKCHNVERAASSSVFFLNGDPSKLKKEKHAALFKPVIPIARIVQTIVIFFMVTIISIQV